MMSLSPRMDLFVFNFPKDFLPQEVTDKYSKVINQTGKLFSKTVSMCQLWFLCDRKSVNYHR